MRKLEAIKINVWGETAGVLTQNTSNLRLKFAFSKEWLAKGIMLSPIVMPNTSEIYDFTSLLRKAEETFHNAPGLIADSLPDDFGKSAINKHFKNIGIDPDTITIIERLAYIGHRGMGALEFEPYVEDEFFNDKSNQIDLDVLVDFAESVLQNRKAFSSSIKSTSLINDIVSIGSSIGGARAKAVVAYNEKTGEIRSGQVKNNPDFKDCVIKLDANSDPRNSEANDYLNREYTYHQMALLAGIKMTHCSLIASENKTHFITERFDRTLIGEKLHSQTLCALTHLDFRDVQSHSYDDLMITARKLNLSYSSNKELFARAVFNVLAVNRDDHTKNHSFIMDKSGIWDIAPAYDLTFSFSPNSFWTRQHALSINGKRDAISIQDLSAFGYRNGIKKIDIKNIIEQVSVAVKQWPYLAATNKVFEENILKINNNIKFSLEGKSLLNTPRKHIYIKNPIQKGKGGPKI